MQGLTGAALGLAVGAGLLAAVNPCGFALLPAYLSAFVLGDDPPDQVSAVVRALRATAALTLGFTSVFIVFGLVVAPVAASVQAYLPAFTVVLGVTLALAGVWGLSGRRLPTITLRRRRRGRSGTPVTATWPAMTGFGASYAIASLGCTIAPFLAVVVTSFRTSNPAAGLVLFLAYAAGMGTTVGVTALAVALARSGLVTTLRRARALIPRLGALVLTLAGTYVAWYGAWELRVLHGSAGRDPVVAAASSIQQWLADRTQQAGLTGLAIVFALLVGVMLLPHRTRHRRPEAGPGLASRIPSSSNNKEKS